MLIFIHFSLNDSLAADASEKRYHAPEDGEQAQSGGEVNYARPAGHLYQEVYEQQADYGGRHYRGEDAPDAQLGDGTRYTGVADQEREHECAYGGEYAYYERQPERLVRFNLQD